MRRPNLAVSRLSRLRWRRRDFTNQHGDGATFKKVFQGFRDRCGYGATQETVRLKKQRRDRSGQRDQKVLFHDLRNRGGAARLSRPRRIRRDFSDQSGDGATFQTEAETALLFRPKRRRRELPDRGGDGATKGGKSLNSDAARPSKSGHESGTSTRDTEQT